MLTESCQEVLGAQVQIPALNTWSRNRKGHQRSPCEPGVVHAFNPEASRPPGVQGQHGLQSKFQASIMCPQKQTNKNPPPQQINKTQPNTHMYTCTCMCTYVHTQCTHSHVCTHAQNHLNENFWSRWGNSKPEEVVWQWFSQSVLNTLGP